MHTRRLEKLRKLIHKNKIDALLVSNPFNLSYLFGFGPRGCLALVSNEARVLFFCPPLYYEQARTRLKFPEVEILNEDNFFRLLGSRKFKRVGFELKDTSFLKFQVLSRKLKGVKLVPREDPVGFLRIIKEPGELALIDKAAGITDEVYREIFGYIKPGLTEIDLANKIEKLLREKGALKASFEPIVAGGPNSAFPHHVPGLRKFSRGDIIVLDLGANYRGYCADLSRTIRVGKDRSAGKSGDKKKINYTKIYNTVLAAQQAAINIVRPGVKCSQLDRVAREVIAQAGLDKFFIHSAGHGVGLEIHELPLLNKKSRDTLQENMVFTVEPGIYIPGWGGVRIEDMVLVTGKGYKILTKAAKRSHN